MRRNSWLRGRGGVGVAVAFAAALTAVDSWIADSIADSWAADIRPADSCRSGRLVAAGQAVVNERLELVIADGRVIRLAGVESLAARGASPEFAALAVEDFALWTSAPVAVVILKTKPDRWGRHPGRVFLEENGDTSGRLASLSEAVIDAGFARVDPATENRPCLDRLYAAERRARKAGRGLWADPAFAVLDARNPHGFNGQAGVLTIVEGQVVSVRAGRGVTFVNLGDGQRNSPYLTLGRHARRAMAREGMKPESLAGRTIRARGVLDLRAGPRIEVIGPGAIELLPIQSER